MTMLQPKPTPDNTLFPYTTLFRYETRPERCAAQGSRRGSGFIGVLPLWNAEGSADGAVAGRRRAGLRRQCGVRPNGGRASLDGGAACQPDGGAEQARPERGVPESRSDGTRTEEHTSELQALTRRTSAVCSSNHNTNAQ